MSQKPKKRLPAPNYTQAPNVYYDQWLREIQSLAELKVVNVVIRQTFGWHQEKAKLSIADLQREAGFRTRHSAIEGARRALDNGYLLRERDGQSWLYFLNVDEEIGSAEDALLTSAESALPELAASATSAPEGSAATAPLASAESALPPTPPYKDKETLKKQEKESSDAIASGADAPSDSPKLAGVEVPKAAKDPEDFRIWNLGVKSLRGTFPREEQARSFLGLQIKEYGKSTVAQAVVEMLAQEPVNPKEYLVKTLEGLSSRARGPQAPIRTPTAAEVEQNTAEAERALNHQRRFALACQGLELAMKTEGLNFHDAIARLVEWGIENEPVTKDFVWNVTRHREFANQPDISLAEFFPEAA